jgi:Cys-tRNA(Pro)/Cys-tRNA(Cys) deacylase
MKQNNVTRLLSARAVPFKLHELPAKKMGALEVADYLQVSPSIVYKTMVVVGRHSGKRFLALLPGPKILDLKALARVLGQKKLIIPKMRAAEKITGLRAGGISPLALLHRNFTCIMDASALNHDEIIISGGQRGIDIQLPVDRLIALINAQVAMISTDP